MAGEVAGAMTMLRLADACFVLYLDRCSLIPDERNAQLKGAELPIALSDVVTTRSAHPR